MMSLLLQKGLLNVFRITRPSSGITGRFYCQDLSKKHLPILTLYTKENCQLCDEAKEKLVKFQGRFQLLEVDITEEGNEKWFGLYRYEIPVFYLGKKFLCKNKIDLDKLKAALDDQ